MSRKKKTPPGGEFSPELLHAIAADEAGCPVDLPVLSPEDVAVLKLILRGEVTPPVAVDVKRAVSALASSERSAEASEILARVVADERETTRVRAAAAAHLSLMPEEEAERALVQNLNADDEIVRVEVIKSLGRVGAGRAFDRLGELPALKTDYARRQLSLARLATSLRAGRGERGVPDKAGLLGPRWVTQEVRAVEGVRVRERAGAIWGSTYGITPNPEVGFEIECGRSKLTLLLNSEVRPGAYVESIAGREMVAGLVVAEEPEVRHFTVRYVIVTTPSGDGFEVTVARTSGDVAYVGEARPDGDGYELTMRDVGLDRFATEIRGRVSDDGIDLNLRVWRGSARAKKHPAPIRLGERR